MTDFLTSQSQDGDAEKASYSFGFQLDSGTGPTKSLNIDVLTGEAADISEAFEIAKQRAADAKQEWLDKLATVSLLGPVSLPKARKKDKITADSGVSDARIN